MFEPTEHEVDDDLRKSMLMFQRSKVGAVPLIEPLRPKKLLLVLDGSSQDETSIGLARQLRQRFECSLDVIDAREQVGEKPLAARVAESLNASAVANSAGDSFDQILDAIGSSGCELVIVPKGTHVAPLEMPDLVNGAITRFLLQHELMPPQESIQEDTGKTASA